MEVWELYRSLASRSRIAIVEALLDNPLTYSEILRQTGTTSTDLSRQLRRLVSEMICEKTSSGHYRLTEYGKLVSTSIPVIKFLADTQEYFNTHDLTYVPARLLDDIYSLRKGQIINSVFEAIRMQQEIAPTIDARYWWMTDDLSPSWIDSTMRQVNDGVVIRAIVNNELAAKMHEEAPPDIWRGISLRVLPEIKLLLGYSDKHALLCLPNMQGVPDRNYYIFGYDFAFKHWVFHCFEYYWKKATPFEK